MLLKCLAREIFGLSTAVCCRLKLRSHARQLLLSEATNELPVLEPPRDLLHCSCCRHLGNPLPPRGGRASLPHLLANLAQQPLLHVSCCSALLLLALVHLVAQTLRRHSGLPLRPRSAALPLDQPAEALAKMVFYNCGPAPMIHASEAVQKEVVSSDRIFSAIDYLTKCGVGICGACASPDGRRICVDGPFISDGLAENHAVLG